jgi:hypothetical protein
VTLRNTGSCSFPVGTVLSETSPVASAALVTVTVPAIAPEATSVVRIHWPGLTSVGTSVRFFSLLGPDDLVIGEPMTFTLRYVAAATQPSPPTSTPLPPPPTATQAAQGLNGVFLSTVSGCHYVGDTQQDYECIGVITVSGGTGPFTVSTDEYNRHFDPGQTLTVPIRARRCFAWAKAVTVFDDSTLTGFTQSQYFDPASNNTFPGGACTVP